MQNSKAGLALRMESKAGSCQHRVGKMMVIGSLLGIMMSQHRSAHLLQKKKASAEQSKIFCLLQQTPEPEITELLEGISTPSFLESNIAQSHRLKRARST